MLKVIAGSIVGVLAWAAIVTLLNFGLRLGLPGYAAVEKAMRFTVAMMAARLAISAASSLAGGAAAARIDPARRAPLIAGVILLALFVPVHYTLWSRFPLWYHLTFLASLPLLGWLGGRLMPRSTSAAR